MLIAVFLLAKKRKKKRHSAGLPREAGLL